MKFTLEYPPSMNTLWRSVPGKGVIKSKVYRSWLEANAWIIQQQVQKQKMEGEFEAIFKIEKPDKRKRDIDNLAKALLDCLVHTKVVEDDHLCQKLTLEWINKNGRTVYCELIARS